MWLVTFLQAVIGALTILVVYRLGRLFLGAGAATIASLWFAFHVHHMHVSYAFERDILAVLLLMLVLLLVVRPFNKMRYALVAGVVYTALIHVDPQYLLLLPVFALFVLFKTRHGLLNIQYLFLFLSVVVLASVPWTIRNYAVYQQPIPIGLEARRFLRPVKVVATEPQRGFSDIEGKIVRASRARIIQRNTVEFWRIAQFRGEKSSDATQTDTTVGRFLAPAWSVRHNLVSTLNYGLVLPFFLLGILFAVRERNRTGLMLAAVAAAYFLMRAYLGGNERTRLPIDPIVILLGFYGIMGLVRRFRRV
jgi:4-amino-4-deoxy-L-arabinose transferase-like glycosyltransferase